MAKTNTGIRETAIMGPECRETFLPISLPELTILRKKGVSFSGISSMRGQYEMRRQNPICHHILYTLKGSGWLRTGSIETILTPMQLWISPSGLPHEFGLHGDCWDTVWCALKDQPPWNIISKIGPCVRNSIMGERFRFIMGEIIWEIQTHDMYTNSSAHLLSEFFLLHLERELNLSEDFSEHETLNKLHLLFSQVATKVQYPWNVNDLANESGLFISPDYFARLCVQHLGTTPMRIVTKLRMDRAKEFLLHTNYTLQMISELVGYKNPFAFSSAFKHWQGCSPRKFRDLEKHEESM